MGIDEKILAQIRAFLDEHSSFAICTHINPDGDALGSAFAMTELVRSLNKKAITVLLDTVPDKYNFPEFRSLYLRLEDVSSSDFDAAIAVDCADLARLSTAKDLFSKLDNLSIDHHGSNDLFADVNYVEHSPATAQMIYELFCGFEKELHRTGQMAIYMGIIADTGGLVYPSTTPRSFEICAQLSAMGLETSSIAEQIFNCRSYAATRLIGVFIPTIMLHFDDRMALSTLSLQQMEECGASVSDTEALINYARDIDTVELACFLRQTKEGTYKLSLRSTTDRIDVAEIAGLFGGGGHARAAGCLMHGSLDSIQADLMQVCRDLFT